MKNRLQDQGGVLVEGALLLALIAVIGVASLTSSGKGVDTSFCTTFARWGVADGEARTVSESFYVDASCPAEAGGPGIVGMGN